MQQNNPIMSYHTSKKLPYGVSNFITIVEQNNYYVDKTMYIPMLEDEASNLFFIRPRRFGKSLFLGMLHAYYDCRTKDKFEQWFGKLWIGQHPTPNQGLEFRLGGTLTARNNQAILRLVPILQLANLKTIHAQLSQLLSVLSKSAL